MKQTTIFVLLMGILQASDAASVFTPFHSWSFGNGTLIVGCNGTLDDVMEPFKVPGMPYVNINAQDRQCCSFERSGDHTHKDCATLDILASTRTPHIVYDITRPMDFVFYHGPATIYLEKLVPTALFNANWTPTDGRILHPETFMNCFHMLRPGGKVAFDFNHTVVIKPGSLPAEFKWNPEIPAVTIETKYPEIFQSALQKITSGQYLNKQEKDGYAAYSNHVTRTVLAQMMHDLKIFGFRKSTTSEGINPYNGRTVMQFLISAEKPNHSK